MLRWKQKPLHQYAALNFKFCNAEKMITGTYAGNTVTTMACFEVPEPDRSVEKLKNDVGFIVYYRYV